MLSVPLSASSAKTRLPIANSASGSMKVRLAVQRDGNLERLVQHQGRRRRLAQNVDVAFECDAGFARADLDIDGDVRRHVIMRQAHDF